MSPKSALSETSSPKHPRQCRFSELLACWDAWDDKGREANARAALCLEDRYYLLVNILGRIDAWHPWVYERCREVEANPDGYIDIWARGHYKSTLITYAGIIQEILRDPEITIGLFSHTSPVAKAFLAQIKREFESNEELKVLFPHVLYGNPEKEAPSWSLDSGVIVRRSGNPKEATVEAHGLVDGQPTSKHFKLMVYDDVVTDKSVYTPEQIIRTTESWELSDNLGAMYARKWIIGTRYHFADTYSEIIKRGAAKSRIYPATDDGTLTGQPVLFTQAEWLRRVRDQGEATVACQLLANPLAGHQRMFDVRDLRVYETRPESLAVYIMVDPARSIRKDSDNTAMVVVGIDVAGNKYLLDGYDHKMELTERWVRMRDLYERWSDEPGVQSVKVGYERYGAQSDLQYFQERMRVEKNQFDVAELEWPREGPGSKVDRVQRLTPDLRNHRLYVPYDTQEDRLTKLQQRMFDSGYDYRIAVPIRRKDENRHAYDLTERLKMQLNYFPLGDKKDVVDALSRLYDLEPEPPVQGGNESLEPEHV